MPDNRYIRQQLVSQLGPESEAKLTNARVLIVGSGGLGSPVSTLLAGAGVGEITLIDDDIVSLSNLHRQTLFTESDIGEFKVHAAKKRLSSINSEITINVIAERLDLDNATELVSGSTVVVDAADNFLASYLLSDLCFAKRIPLVSASVLTTHGYLGVYCGTQNKPAPSLRAVFPAPSSDVNNCNTAGVTGPSVGIIGSYQAQEVLKVITQSESQLLGKLMSLDLWDYRQHIIDFNQSPEPTLSAPLISLSSVHNNDYLLDVRSPQECSEDPVELASGNIPLAELQSRHHELPNNTRIVCVCKSGQRALSAAQLLINHGHSEVYVTAR